MRCANLRQNAPFRQPKTLNAELSASGASFGLCIHLYIHTHFSFWHGVALGWTGWRPIAVGDTGFCYGYFARWAQYAFAFALFRLRSIRAQARPIAWRQYGLLLRLFRPLGSIRLRVRPGLRFAYPGLYSGAPSGRVWCGRSETRHH